MNGNFKYNLNYNIFEIFIDQQIGLLYWWINKIGKIKSYFQQSFGKNITQICLHQSKSKCLYIDYLTI